MSFYVEVKAFFIIFRGLLIKQITQIFLEGESPTLKMLHAFKKLKKWTCEHICQKITKFVNSSNFLF